jgi:hypothetical protein
VNRDDPRFGPGTDAENEDERRYEAFTDPETNLLAKGGSSYEKIAAPDTKHRP